MGDAAPSTGAVQTNVSAHHPMRAQVNWCFAASAACTPFGRQAAASLSEWLTGKEVLFCFFLYTNIYQTGRHAQDRW